MASCGAVGAMAYPPSRALRLRRIRLSPFHRSSAERADRCFKQIVTKWAPLVSPSTERAAPACTGRIVPKAARPAVDVTSAAARRGEEEIEHVGPSLFYHRPV